MVIARQGNLTPPPRQMVQKQHLDRIQVRRARLASDSIAGVYIGYCGRVFAFTVLDSFIRIIAHTTHSRLAFFISWLQHAYEIRCWGETLRPVVQKLRRLRLFLGYAPCAHFYPRF